MSKGKGKKKAAKKSKLESQFEKAVLETWSRLVSATQLLDVVESNMATLSDMHYDQSPDAIDRGGKLADRQEQFDTLRTEISSLAQLVDMASHRFGAWLEQYGIKDNVTDKVYEKSVKPFNNGYL